MVAFEITKPMDLFGNFDSIEALAAIAKVEVEIDEEEKGVVGAVEFQEELEDDKDEKGTKEKDKMVPVVKSGKSPARRLSSFMKNMFTSGSKEAGATVGENLERDAALDKAAEIRAEKKRKDQEERDKKAKERDIILAFAGVKAASAAQLTSLEAFEYDEVAKKTPTPAAAAAAPVQDRRRSQSLFSKDAAFAKSRPRRSSLSNSLARGSKDGDKDKENTESKEFVGHALSQLDDFTSRMEMNAAEENLLETIFRYSSDEVRDVIATMKACRELLAEQLLVAGGGTMSMKLMNIRKEKVTQVSTTISTYVEAVLSSQAQSQVQTQVQTQVQADADEAADVSSSQSEPAKSPTTGRRRLSIVPMQEYPGTVAGGTEGEEDTAQAAVQTYSNSSNSGECFDDSIIGSRIQIRYHLEDGIEQWSDGIVVGYLEALKRHEIIFDDGLRVDLDLSEETIRLEA